MIFAACHVCPSQAAPYYWEYVSKQKLLFLLLALSIALGQTSPTLKAGHLPPPLYHVAARTAPPPATQANAHREKGLTLPLEGEDTLDLFLPSLPVPFGPSPRLPAVLAPTPPYCCFLPSQFCPGGSYHVPSLEGSLLGDVTLCANHSCSPGLSYPLCTPLPFTYPPPPT